MTPEGRDYFNHLAAAYEIVASCIAYIVFWAVVIGLMKWRDQRASKELPESKPR